MSEKWKEYLGDGVYAEFDGWQVWVWTSNGVEESEHIALEPAVIDRLNEFFQRCRMESGRSPR